MAVVVRAMVTARPSRDPRKAIYRPKSQREGDDPGYKASLAFAAGDCSRVYFVAGKKEEHGTSKVGEKHDAFIGPDYVCHARTQKRAAYQKKYGFRNGLFRNEVGNDGCRGRNEGDEGKRYEVVRHDGLSLDGNTAVARKSAFSELPEGIIRLIGIDLCKWHALLGLSRFCHFSLP